MIIFIYGSDSWRAQHKVNELKQKFRQKVDTSGSSITLINGEEFDIGQWRQSLLSQSLFSRGRLVLVRDLLVRHPKKDLQEQIIEVLDKVNNHTVVWWENIQTADSLKKIKNTQLFKYLNKQDYVQIYDHLNQRQLEKWVQDRVVELGGKIAPVAVKILFAQVGDNLWQLDNEIQKLVLFADGTEIDSKMVYNLTLDSLSGDGWEFLYFLSQKNKPEAMRLLEEQLVKGTEVLEIFNRIVWQFRVLLLIKDVLDKQTFTSNEMATRLGMHPFVVQKSLPVVKNFTLKQLKDIYQQLSEIDYRLKTGLTEPAAALDLFILGL